MKTLQICHINSFFRGIFIQVSAKHQFLSQNINLGRGSIKYSAVYPLRKLIWGRHLFCFRKTFVVFHDVQGTGLRKRARWYIGMPSASHAAGPGSNPGEGDKMTTQIDRFSTFVFFRILRGGRMRKRLQED